MTLPPSIYADAASGTALGSSTPYGESRVDIAVVGGGFTGVSAALNLAERGFSVSLFEAEKIGYGASGRNGGQLCQGWTVDFAKIAGKLPPHQRRMAWEVGLMGRKIILARCAKHTIDAELRFGYLHAALHERHMAELRAMRDEWQREGYGGFELLGDAAALTPHIRSDAFVGGLFDAESGHLHPIKYLYGLAQAAVAEGVKIHENCSISKIEYKGERGVNLHHKNGVICADRLVLAGNAYLGGVAPKVMQSRLAPVTSGIMATEPLPDAVVEGLLPGRIAVADCNTALNYFRFDNEGRMLFGGRASYLAQEGGAIEADLRRRMLGVFPSLRDVAVDRAWWGRIGITLNRIPHMGKIGENTWFVQGYSGHGVALSGVLAEIIAEAIAGDRGRFDAFASISHLPFPGGILRTPALAVGMAWYKMRDALRL